MASRASLIASLKTRRDAVISQIETLASDGLDLPNASGDGVNSDFLGYKKGLYDELLSIEQALNRLDVGIHETQGT